jgi:hypothetical protein
MRWIFLGIVLFNGLTARSQLISLENAASYIGKTITVYGKVTEAYYNETRRRDTCTLTLLDEASGQSLLVKILPEMRAGFGYRPEQALLNKLAYFSGNLQIRKGVAEMYLTGPFSISFKKGEAIYEPKDQPLPLQPKPLSTAKNNQIATRPSARPIPETVQSATPKRRKREPKVEEPKVEKRAKQADDRSVVVAEPVVAKHPDVPSEKPANTIVKSTVTKEETTKKIEVPQEKNTATANTYNGTAPNPNPLSTAPIVHTDLLVGTEMILKSKINLRGGPGGFFTTSGSLTKGEIVKILSCSFDWCKVIQVNDKIIRLQEGYVKADKLKQ